MKNTMSVGTILSVLVTIGSAQIKFNRSPGQIAASGRTEIDNRLGLLASTLGVAPVPGSTAGWTCGCSNTPTSDGSGLINIRVVNQPPAGGTCPPGYSYTCIPSTPPAPLPPDVPTALPPAENRDRCGVRTIVPVPVYQSGQAEFGEYPWVAVILDQTDNYVGSGAILDSLHILTVAHRVTEFRSGMKVRLGEWNTLDNSEPFKHVEIDIDSVAIHPAFNSQNLQNDVAVITLKGPLHLGAYPHIRSVCLPKRGTDFVGQRCWVAGFGKDAFNGGKYPIYMKEVDVPIVGWNECENRLRGTKLGNFFVLNRNSFICAGGEIGKDACTEDGGAPLVCQDANNGQFRVVGLVAWGIGCAENSVPGVYVNIHNFLDFIENKLK